jgi:hypothetical protein
MNQMDLLQIILWDRETPVREYRTVEGLLAEHNTTLETMHNIWICRSFRGELMWTFHDLNDEITHETRNELHKRFRHKPAKIATIASSWLSHLLRMMVMQKDYDSVESCTSFINSKNKQWKSEAQYLIQLRDSVYEQAIEYLNGLPSDEGGLLVYDFSDEPLLAAIPKIEWPASS